MEVQHLLLRPHVTAANLLEFLGHGQRWRRRRRGRWDEHGGDTGDVELLEVRFEQRHVAVRIHAHVHEVRQAAHQNHHLARELLPISHGLLQGTRCPGRPRTGCPDRGDDAEALGLVAVLRAEDAVLAAASGVGCTLGSLHDVQLHPVLVHVRQRGQRRQKRPLDASDAALGLVGAGLLAVFPDALEGEIGEPDRESHGGARHAHVREPVHDLPGPLVHEVALAPDWIHLLPPVAGPHALALELPELPQQRRQFRGRL
mmetsp:Transcript_47973/g.120928  ORF Transcript_47973/g.120928 Transcript_47973/m.120928 type:complete len:258 (-) Transcript_47973:671-1444(-)